MSWLRGIKGIWPLGDQGRNLTFNELRPLDTTSNAISDCLQRIESKFDALVKGQDRLLQSHAALEQKLQSIEERLPTKLFAEVASVADALSRLDARLKGTGDALSVEIHELREEQQNSLAKLGVNLARMHNGISSRARRKGKK